MEKPANPRAAGRRLILLCGVAPALVTAALAILTPSLFTQLDRRVYDGLLRSLPAPNDSTRVVIVDIDDRSLAAIGQWPWSRDVVARLVTRLRDLGAAVIALDVIFPERDRFERADRRAPGQRRTWSWPARCDRHTSSSATRLRSVNRGTSRKTASCIR